MQNDHYLLPRRLATKRSRDVRKIRKNKAELGYVMLRDGCADRINERIESDGSVYLEFHYDAVLNHPEMEKLELFEKELVDIVDRLHEFLTLSEAKGGKAYDVNHVLEKRVFEIYWGEHDPSTDDVWVESWDRTNKGAE